MILGRVVGTVWGGKEAESLHGAKVVQVQSVAFRPNSGVLEVQADTPDVPLRPCIRLALDQLGAGVGEFVLVAHGSRVRDLTVGPEFPVKDLVVAIVDSCEVDTSLFPEVAP